LEKLEKPVSLDEKAYRNIKDAILKCMLAPGEFLAEVRLAEDLGVSKTPIRQAMARLQQEGFLETVPYKGHFVARVSVEDISEIYGLRQLLEGHLVRETARRFTREELAEIEADIDAAQQALENDDVEQYVLLNREFHHCFDRKYGHSRISDVLTNLDEHVQRIIFYAIKNDYYDLLTRQCDDHRLIFKAVSEGAVETAVTRMQNHLSEFCDDLVVRLKRTDMGN
jgi:DNA-binding GntR family transcriptional regulator